MVIVDCLEHLLVLGLVTECVVALSAQSHQVFYGISIFASSHTTSFYVVDVYGLRSAYLARNPIGGVVAHPLQVDLCVVLHLSAL